MVWMCMMDSDICIGGIMVWICMIDSDIYIYIGGR